MESQNNVIELLKSLESKFRVYRRRRIGYKFKGFGEVTSNYDSVKCRKNSASYTIVVPKTAQGNKEASGTVVVCHPTKERSVYTIQDFLSRYEIKKTSTAYPVVDYVLAYFPDREVLKRLGNNNTFINLWGREDKITSSIVVIQHTQNSFYTKDKEAFRKWFSSIDSDKEKA
jgi:hypothetical protein